MSSRAPNGEDPASGLDGDDYTTVTSWTSDGLVSRVRSPGRGHDDFDVVTYGYDAVGNPVRVKSPSGNAADATNPDGLATVNTFTQDNLIATSAVPIGTGVYRATAYGYTPSGQKAVASVGRCTTTTPADCSPGSDPGDGSLWHGGATTRYGYAPDGLATLQTGRDESSISTGYDAGGRVATVASSENQIVVAASYYLDGSVRTVDDGTNANTYAYTGSGMVSVRTDHTAAGGVSDGATKTTSYAYSAAELPAAMASDVTNATSSWVYDVAGRLVGRTDEASGGPVRSVANDYNADDSLAATTVRAGGPGASVVGKNVYAYDDDGDVVSDTVSGTQSLTRGYSYNPAGNLTGFSHSGYADTTYGWDHDANRVSASSAGTGGGTSTWSYRADDSLVSANPAPGGGATVAYHYSDAGELTRTDADAGAQVCSTYAYDGFGRMASQSQKSNSTCGSTDRASTSYTYDGLDRVQRTVTHGVTDATTRSSYDGLSSTVVGQTGAVNGADTDPAVLYQLSVDGAATGLAQYTAPGAGSPDRVWLDKDGSGSVTGLLGSGASSVSCVVDYDPFGSPVDPAHPTHANAVCGDVSGADAGADSTGNVVWYRSAVRDPSYGTYQFGARTYDPSLAAFTTPDSRRVDTPAEDLSVGTDPLTLNGYAYVNGDPVNLSDPDGHVQRAPDGGDTVCDVACATAGQIAAGLATVAWAHAQAQARVEAAVHHRSGLSRVISGFFGGAGAEALDTGRFFGTEVLKLQTNYYFTPQGIAESFARARGLAHSVLHPKQTAGAVWAGCAADGAHCAGGLAFDVATLFVGGEGLAAGASRGVEVLQGLGRAGEKTATGLGDLLGGAGDGLASRLALRDERGSLGLGRDTRTPRQAANGGEDLARVGRWMSQSEHEAMVSTGRVQPGRFSPHTDVSYPASPTAFSPTNPLTSRYVEFNVPRSSLVQGGKEGWAHIPGPDSIFSRLAVNRGGAPFEYPGASDIQWVASWIG